MRCSYKEGNHRCVKNATIVVIGQQAFCRAHAMVVMNAATPRANVESVVHKAADMAGDLLRDFLDGRPINRQKVASALNDFASQAARDYAAGYYQGSADPGRARARRPRPQQEPDPEAERRQAITAARAALGFSPTETISREQLKTRHRELAKKHHPDRGGSLERMQAVNAAVETLESTL